MLRNTHQLLRTSISGGGYKSMFTATGVIQEMNSLGLFESLTYISGLSGGSWVLLDLILHEFDPNNLLKYWDFETSIFEDIPDFNMITEDITDKVNINKKFTSVTEGRFEKSTKHLQNRDNSNNKFYFKRGEFPFVINLKNKFLKNIVSTNKTIKCVKGSKIITKIADFYLDIHLKVKQKKLSGFLLSLTDYWSQILIQRVTNTPILLDTTSFYDLIRRNAHFIKNQAPIPIFVANCKNGRLKNFIFEFTPFEFGTWEKDGGLFMELKYLGSFIKNGFTEKCYRQFDDIGFIVATSSSIFNNAIALMWKKLSQSSLLFLSRFEYIMKIFGIGDFNNFPKVNCSFQRDIDRKLQTDYAIYYPNPFFQYKDKNVTKHITNDKHLYLVDGGVDGENIPLRNLMLPMRKIECIFIIDSSADAQNYTNGTKLKNILDILKLDGIEYLQEKNQSLEFKIRKSHSIFGCSFRPNKYNYTVPPILIYYGNHEKVFKSNISTFKSTYSKEEVGKMVQNGRSIFQCKNEEDIKIITDCLPCFLLKRRLDSIFDNGDHSYEFNQCNHYFKSICLS